MCGIAGLHSLDARPSADAMTIAAMCRLLAHRGRDEPGIHEGGATQLGIRGPGLADLRGPRGLVANEDRSVWAVCDGAIHNARELRRELEALGHVFRGDSDAECIVHAWETWKEGAFARLRGLFAIAILDQKGGKLALARDRVGARPLYYTVLPDSRLAFASELKGLFAIPEFRPVVSPLAMRDYFALGYVPSPRSIWEGVYKLPPGHCLVASGGHTTERPYWQLAYGPKWQEGEAGLKARLREKLEDAVRMQLAGEESAGVFLGGGLGSGVVAALAARQLGRPLQTFSVGFRGEEADERPQARELARHLGAEHHELLVGADTVSLMPELTWHFDEPFGDASALPTWLASQLAAGHVKTVLTGDGASEVFAGHRRYREFLRLDAVAHATLGLGAPSLRLLAAKLSGPEGQRLGRLADRLARRWPDRYLSGVALNTAADLRGLLRPEVAGLDPYAGIRQHFSREDIPGRLEQLLWGDLRSHLADEVLVRLDRMTMAHSIEARTPLLDQELVAFTARLPARLKLRGRESQYLLGQVARELLPARLQPSRQGFALPLAGWLRGELRELMLDTLSGHRLQQRGIFDVRGVGRCIGEHLAGTHDHGARLWLLLGYELWARRFVDERPQALPAPAMAA